MPTYVFSGTVTPERAWTEFQKISFNINHQEADISGYITFQSFKNQIICRFISDVEISSIFTLKNIISDNVQMVLDSACLDTTAATLVDIKSCCYVEADHIYVFGVNVEEIGITNAENREVFIEPILMLSAQNRYFRRALGDFRQSIINGEDTGFYCYRAIESLINSIKSSESINNKKHAIEILNARLNLSPECIERLRNLSGETRHGHPVWISGEDRVIAIRITREIIQRFSQWAIGTSGFSELHPT